MKHIDLIATVLDLAKTIIETGDDRVPLDDLLDELTEEHPELKNFSIGPDGADLADIVTLYLSRFGCETFGDCPPDCKGAPNIAWIDLSPLAQDVTVPPVLLF